jgi:hypothetical protein
MAVRVGHENHWGKLSVNIFKTHNVSCIEVVVLTERESLTYKPYLYDVWCGIFVTSVRGVHNLEFPRNTCGCVAVRVTPFQSCQLQTAKSRGTQSEFILGKWYTSCSLGVYTKARQPGHLPFTQPTFKPNKCRKTKQFYFGCSYRTKVKPEGFAEGIQKT